MTKTASPKKEATRITFLLIVFFGVLIGVIFLGIFKLRQSFNNPLDLAVVQSIPVYPNSKDWKAKSDTGFPDGSPSGTIVFYTQDSDDQIYNFYLPVLLNDGWRLEKINPNKQIRSGYDNPTAIFRKKKGEYYYAIEIVKSYKESISEDYMRVIIFVNHSRCETGVEQNYLLPCIQLNK